MKHEKYVTICGMIITKRKNQLESAVHFMFVKHSASDRVSDVCQSFSADRSIVHDPWIDFFLTNKQSECVI